MSPRWTRTLTVLSILIVGFLTLLSVTNAQEPVLDPDAEKGRPNPPSGAFDPGPGATPGEALVLRGEGEFIPIPPQCTSNEVSASRFNTIAIPATGTPVVVSTLFVA